MDYKRLKTELALPAYNGVTDAQALAALTTADQQRPKSSLRNKEILEACDPAELVALTGDAAASVWGLLGIDEVDPYGNAAQVFVNAFGAGSMTITNLQALRVEYVTRADVIGISPDDLSVQVIATARVGSW